MLHRNIVAAVKKQGWPSVKSLPYFSVSNSFFFSTSFSMFDSGALCRICVWEWDIMYVKHQSGKTLLAHHHLPCSYVLLSISTCGRVHVHNTCVCFIHCLVYFCKTKQKKGILIKVPVKTATYKTKVGKKIHPMCLSWIMFSSFYFVYSCHAVLYLFHSSPTRSEHQLYVALYLCNSCSCDYEGLWI